MKVVLTSSVLVILVLAGCSLVDGNKSGVSKAATRTTAAPVAVQTQKPEVGPVAQTIALTGTVTAYEQVTLYAKTSGYLRRINVDIGDRVSKGAMLAELDAPELETAVNLKQANLLRAEAAVEEAAAAVEKTRAETAFATTYHARLKRIHKRDSDLLPENDVDQAGANVAVATAGVSSAEAQVKVAQSAVAAAKADLRTSEELMRYTRVTAPISGIITERFVDPGALIQAASSSRTQAAPVVSIARVDRVRIVIDVPESDSQYVRSGSAAVITFLDHGTGPIAAKVARSSGVLNPASRTMRVEIDLQNLRGLIRSGMTAHVALETQRGVAAN